MSGILVSGCESAAPARVEGDIYLALDLDSQVNFAGTQVHLLRDLLGIDSLLIPICAQRDQAFARARDVAAADPMVDVDSVLGLATDEAWASRAETLHRMVLRTVETDDQSAFRIDSVPPGVYRLWSDASTNGERWTWLTRFRLGSGESIRLNLTNANADMNPFRCA